MSKAAVDDLVKHGRLFPPAVIPKENGRGNRLNVAAAREQLSQLRPRTKPPGSASGDPADYASTGALANPNARLNVNEERAKLVMYQALTAKLAYEKANGEVLMAEDVKSVWAKEMTMLRTHLTTMPGRYHQQLPHLSNHDIRVLETLIHDMAVEWAEAFPR